MRKSNDNNSIGKTKTCGRFCHAGPACVVACLFELKKVFFTADLENIVEKHGFERGKISIFADF